MGANPPTCGKCGSILMGYGWNDALKFPVHFCTKCSGQPEPAPKVGVLKAAA
jgi:hypothetical protein